MQEELPTAESDLAYMEDVRRRHISHEAYVISAGTLCLLWSFLVFFWGIIGIPESAASPWASGPVWSVVLMTFGLFMFCVGVGLRLLAPWARIPAALLSVLSMIAISPQIPGEAIASSLVIPAYIVYLVLSRKGKVVFSPAYRDIITATPHVKYKTSVLTWMIVVALVLLVGIGVFAAVG